jgi:signal transduction histidine kinase
VGPNRMTLDNGIIPRNTARRSPLLFRFAWALGSAAVTFLAVFVLDWIFARYGLRREETLIDNCLLSALVFGLVLGQQLRHERELERNRKVLAVIADMNHHTRNALQVIVGRSSLSMADSTAIAEIRDAVKRIEWSLREVLPTVSEIPSENARNDHKMAI